MNFFIFFLFLIKTLVFQKLEVFEKTLIPFQILLYLNILLNCYIARRLLLKRSALCFISTVIIEFHLSRFLVINYYDKAATYYSDTDLNIIYTVVTCLFCLLDKEIYNEIERDYVFNYIYKSLRNLTFIYRYTYFFYVFHSDKLKFSNTHLNFFLQVITDLLIINTMEVIGYFLKFLSSKSKQNYYLARIFKRVVVQVLISLAYQIINNISFAEFIYDGLNHFLPMPHSLIVYNAFPIDNEARFKLIIYLIIELIL